LERIILRQTPGSVRATILSVDSMLNQLFLAAVSPLIGVVADQYGLSHAFVYLGIGFGVVLLVLLFLWDRVRQTS
jgi:MFS-type transporter involved in bile tolerance (Atg22 family)